jgi:superfamily II DNA or RNA helicase
MIVDSILKIEIPELSSGEWERLEKSLTFVTESGEVVITYRKLRTKGIYKMPRGAWYLLPSHIRYRDNRSCPPMPKLKFKVKLDDVAKDERFRGQSEAVAAMFDNEQGLIVRPPGTGKTQIAMAFMAQCETRSLVLVHTEDILNQWVDYIERAIPSMKGKVGIIRGSKCKVGHITVAMVQSLKSYNYKPRKWWAQWGCLIVDEAHHVAAQSWEAIVNVVPARYRFGFTASPTRADGFHPALKFIIGPVIHKQDFSSPVNLQVVPCRTKFFMPYRGSFDWQRLLNSVVENDRRNQYIARIIDREVERGHSVLVLSRRIEQLDRVAGIISSDCEILTSERNRAERRAVLDKFRDGSLPVLLATQLADEALDVQRLSRVLLIHPGKAEGRLIQQVGRALRKFPDKKDARIYDFVDWRVKILRRQWTERKRIYKKNGIEIKLRKGRDR